MTTRIILSLLLLLALPSFGLSAQSADFHRLRDSLSRVRDAHALRRLEAARRPPKTASATAFVEHGLIAQRLYDLTADHSANKLAIKAFESAVARDPNLGWAHFGLGIGLASSPEAKPLSEGGSRGRLVLDNVAKKLLGMDARSRARREFNAALNTVPPIHQAARELAALSLTTWNRESLEEARAALQALVDQGRALSDDLVALANVQTALGQTNSAAETADRARAADPTNASALFASALARLRSKERAAEGADLYFQSIAAADSVMLEALFADVKPVATNDEKARWKNGATEARRELLRTFWDVRAARGVVTVPSRLAEHYERVATAERQYRRNGEFGVPVNPLRQTPAQTWSRFDDRGEIFVRHGEPFRVVRSMNAEVLNESWIYQLPDGSVRSYHFFKYPTNPDYLLPYVLPCDVEFWQDRAIYEARAGMFGLRCSANSMLAYSAEWREHAYHALETDTHYRRFARELPFLYDLYTFRGAPGKTAVVAAFAVPANALEATSQEGQVHYRFDLSLILADTARGSVSRTDDSASIFMPRPLRGDDLLRAHLEVQVPPSPSTLQRVIVTDPTEPGIGMYYGGPFPIPDYSGKNLMLSDIALGEVETRRGWKRGEHTLALLPTNQFKAGNFALYYEIYNLPAGVHYTTEVVIDKVDKGTGDKIRELFGGDTSVRVKFEGESTANAEATLAEMRRLQVPLGKGRYRLTVTVKNLSTGQTAKGSRTFVIPD
jgi:tetratricopeptide (TPR) repeat protein